MISTNEYSTNEGIKEIFKPMKSSLAKKLHVATESHVLSEPSDSKSHPQRSAAGVKGHLAKLLLNAKQLVVLGNPVAARS